jgi:putative redox protein
VYTARVIAQSFGAVFSQKGEMIMSSPLVTSAATARQAGESGRALVALRGHHVVVDSPLALGGPNEEVNPMDLLLASLATCATFLCEYVAQEEDIPLADVRVSVASDFDPRGMCGHPVNPSIQALRLHTQFRGITDEQAATLVQAIRTRCPIFTTLAKAVEIDIEFGVQSS